MDYGDIPQLIETPDFESAVQQTFVQYDEDQSGSLDTDELQAVMTALFEDLGVPLTCMDDDSWDEFLNFYDADGNGVLDFQEFLFLFKDYMMAIYKEFTEGGAEAVESPTGIEKSASSESSDDDSTASSASGGSDAGADDGSTPAKFLPALRRHNEYRKRHGAPPMTWDAGAAATAQAWAEELASESKFEHGGNDIDGTRYGQNLAAGVDAKGAVDMWYNEIKDYDFDNQGFSMKCGHFTQVVWKGSTKLGMGFVQGGPYGTTVVAHYLEAGNMMGDFEDNVQKGSGKHESPSPKPVTNQDGEETWT